VSTLDKYEYKVRADEIKALIAEGEYAEAVKIADTIDWRRVKSVMMLCTVSDLYKINRRYEDSRDILLLAYEKHTGGRLIVYSLCELSIKLEEYVQAIEYYKEFVQLAPKDSGRYVLQYKLYEAQEVSLEERIAVLEEFKKKDYREKWAYELAYLYHRVGLESKCVEECDEMFLWFGDGRYVLKALELKQLHQPLTPDQQEKYEMMRQTGGIIESEYVTESKAIKEEANVATEEEDDDEFSIKENVLTDPTQEIPSKEIGEIEVKTVDVSQYNTINLQKELAESMKEFLENNPTQEMPVAEIEYSMDATQMMPSAFDMEQEENPDFSESIEEAPTEEEMTAYAAGMAEFTGETVIEEEEVQEESDEPIEQDGMTQLYVSGDTDEMLLIAEEEPVSQEESVKALSMPVASPDPSISNTGVIKTFTKPSGYDNILSQEYDGQISLVVPEEEKIEKQITGQLSIEDVMAEWERVKKENEQKRMQEIKERVKKQTNTLFADFDESTKTGLLEELEKAMITAAMMEEKKRIEEGRPRIIKVADIEKEEEAKQQNVAKEVVPAPKDSVPEIPAEVLSEEDEVEELQEIEEQDTTTEDVFEEEADANEETGNDIEEVTVAEEKPEAEAKDTEADAQADDAESEGDEAAVIETEERTEVLKGQTREMTQSEREQFAPFIHHKRTRRQIVEAIDNISMASYTGNVVVTGEEGTGTTALAKLLVKEVQLADNNFSGKVAKISASTMNKKDVGATLDKLEDGALIIEEASAMKKATVESLIKELNQEDNGIIVLLTDSKQKMEEFLDKYRELLPLFNLRVDVEALDDQTLVKYAKKYAFEQEYAIDELGILALHTRIAEMQTSDHEVTLAEIEELIDEAIYFADKKTPKHFFDVLLGKRYDEEDMIILREKDFMHY